MNYTQATKYLQRALKNGYVAYHGGIVSQDGSYGINIDGDGHQGRLFGCPQIIWDSETAERKFPARKYNRKDK